MQKPLTCAALFPLVIVSLLVLVATGCHKASPAASSPEAKEQSLAWNMKTTTTAYTNAGFTNMKWDEPARECLAEYARARANLSNPYYVADDEVISANAAAAVKAGCNDPLVNYLYLRYFPPGGSKEAIAEDFSKVAQELDGSSYPPARKMYAAIRTLDNAYRVYDKEDPKRQSCLDTMWSIVDRNLPGTLADKSMPEPEVYEVCERVLYLSSGSEKNNEYFREAIEKNLSKNWSDSYATYLLKGQYYIDLAWKARGSGYSDSVTKDGWEGFNKALGDAQASLEHAWKLNPSEPKIPEKMITVMLGQGGGRDRMEVWFNRAMEVNTNDYTACHDKLYYLEPKWYGSDEAQLEFGHECVQSTKWGGRVPLILVDAHLYINARNEGEARTNYWKQPQVWADVQAAYERFFELNPDATDWYHNYAWYAYHAEQWDKLNELIPKLGRINYNYFGGREEFEKMVQLAKEHSHSASDNK